MSLTALLGADPLLFAIVCGDGCSPSVGDRSARRRKAREAEGLQVEPAAAVEHQVRRDLADGARNKHRGIELARLETKRDARDHREDLYTHVHPGKEKQPPSHVARVPSNAMRLRCARRTYRDGISPGMAVLALAHDARFYYIA